METAKALHKAIRVLESRSGELHKRIESANADYEKAEKTGASGSMLVSYVASIINAQEEYEINRQAMESLKALYSVLTSS